MKTKRWFPALLSVMLLLAGLLLSGCSGSISIDLNECVNVTYRGYEGEGTASVDIDENYILPLLGDMNTLSAASVIDSLRPESIENNGKLSNGDKITVKINCNNDTLNKAGVKVKNTELSYVVAGLPKYITTDADMTADDKKLFENAAYECISAHIENGSVSSSTVIENLTGVDLGFFPAIDVFETDGITLGGAYVVSKDDPSVVDYYNPRCCIYYFYNVNVTYKCSHQTGFYEYEELEGTADYTFAVCLDIPEKDPANGTTYNRVYVKEHGKDFDTVYNSIIPSEGFTVEKLS